MKYLWILFVFTSINAFSQNEAYDLRDQIGLIKDLMPEVQVVGVIIGQKDEDLFQNVVNMVQRDFNIRVALAVVKAPKTRNVKFLNSLFKDYAVQMLNRDTNVILFGFGKDHNLKNIIGIKAVAEVSAKFGVPTFSSHKKALKVGCSGRFIFEEDWWKLHLDSEKTTAFSISVPPDDDRFISE